MTFSIHQGGVVKSSPFKLTQTLNTLPLAQMPGNSALIFSSCATFTVYPNRIMQRHPTPLQVIIHQSVGMRSERTQCHAKMAALNSIIYICRALHSNKQTNNNDLLEKDGGTKNCIYKD